MKKIIVLAALAAISATASASTNLLTNGSFEDTLVAANHWSAFTSVPGWTITKADGTATSHGLEIRNHVVGTAEDGANFIELDGYENDKIEQSFSTVVGKEYEVSFWFADRAGVAASTEGFSASVVSGVASADKTIGSAGNTAWHLITLDFTAASTTSIFTITAAGSSDGLGTSFDNFSAAGVVPEPATMGLFAAGLAVLGLSRRRRQ